ncbi:hypothetical protein GGS21DRAFT_536059 [Xylaria nigripes]|nr:hypothetical protein GGS21DRAFT_536059 [Xylaria nigripes]
MFMHWISSLGCGVNDFIIFANPALELIRNRNDHEFGTENLIALYCNVCAQRQRLRDSTLSKEERNESAPAAPGPVRSRTWSWRNSDVPPVLLDRPAAYAMQPLFGALFTIALFYANTKVQLVLTGITEGLSAPISFEELRDEALEDSYHPAAKTIMISLSAAVKFIMRLKSLDREAEREAR